jgi:hypothetical protein
MLNRKLRKQLRKILNVYERVEDSKTVEPERIKDDPRLERDLRELALLADLGALRGYVLIYTYCKPGDREVTWTGSFTHDTLRDDDPGNVKLDSMTMLRDGLAELGESVGEELALLKQTEEELIRRWKTGDPDMDEEATVLAEKLDAAGQPHLRLVR